MCSKSAFVIAALAGAAAPAVSFAQLQFVTTIPGSFTDITGDSIELFPSTEYQTYAPTTLGPRVANIAFPQGDIFLSILGTLGYSVNADFHNTNTALPSSSFYAGAAAAAVYWDDLQHTLPGAGVYSAEITENGVPVQIFQWNQLDHTPGSSGHATFELKIFGSGAGPGGALAQYIYQSTAFGDVALDSGASATIGYQLSGTSGTQYSFNTASVPGGTVLSLVPAGPTGSCCIGTQACTVAGAATCAARGGVYHGDGTTCASAGCASGACCLPAGCIITSSSACAARAGVYHGDGSACAQAGCPVNLVTNASFEDQSVTQLAPAWWLTPAVNGSHFVRETLVSQGNTPDGVNFVMFGAAGPQRDVISQTLATVPGHQYTLSFWLASPHAGSDSIQALWNGTVVFDQTPTTLVYDWTHFTVAVTAPGPTSILSFAGYDSTSFISLDDITLFDTGSSNNCYPNCDQSTAPPILNVADFTCFFQKFATSDPYANCDGSTSEPILNVADFTCFLQRYAAGCH
jgi:hypothetical protein